MSQSKIMWNEIKCELFPANHAEEKSSKNCQVPSNCNFVLIYSPLFQTNKLIFELREKKHFFLHSYESKEESVLLQTGP